MQTVTTIGLDIAKSVFQVHGIDAEGNVVFRRQLKRRYVVAFFQKLPSCLVGVEACASSHHWSRELQALGHTVRLMPPAYVKPYVKRHKNDATDAEAICEAVARPNMRFVATKTPEQQSCLTLHRTRHLFIRQQTSVINVIRAHLAEFGIVAPVGRNGVEQLLGVAADANDKRLLRALREMDKKIAGLLGAAAAFTMVGAAQAAPEQPTKMAPATSYRDLLDTIPNALPLLKSDDARFAEAQRMEVAQIDVKVGRGHHHHHHHHHHHGVVVRLGHGHHDHHTTVIHHD
jgi:Transposase